MSPLLPSLEAGNHDEFIVWIADWSQAYNNGFTFHSCWQSDVNTVELWLNWSKTVFFNIPNRLFLNSYHFYSSDNFNRFSAKIIVNSINHSWSWDCEKQVLVLPFLNSFTQRQTVDNLFQLIYRIADNHLCLQYYIQGD